MYKFNTSINEPITNPRIFSKTFAQTLFVCSVPLSQNGEIWAKVERLYAKIIALTILNILYLQAE
jgi:hypothetical protein